MSAKNTERKIAGSVIESGRMYKAGDEDALAAIMQGKSVSHLVEKGVITGDWGSSEGAQSEDELDAQTDEEQPLPKLADMAEHLAGLSTIEEVEAMQARDDRAGAVKHYEARLAELAPETEE